jgi:hypothetical protein
MNEEKDNYKGLYFEEDNNDNEDDDDHNHEYGAHFKYKELYNKLIEIAKERNKEKNNSNKKEKNQTNYNVLKGVSRNKENKTGENILIYLKNINNLSSSKNNNESFKSASFNKVNDNDIKLFSNKNTINNTKNARTVLRHILFPKNNKKINDILSNNKKIHNTNNNSSYKKIKERILFLDKSSKSVQNRNSKKNTFNHQIFQIQNNKLKEQIRNYFNKKYSKLFANYNTLYKKLSPNKYNLNDNETINKIKSIPNTRNYIPLKKKIKKNIIKITEKKSFSKNPSNQSLTNKDNNKINKNINNNNIKTYSNKTSFVYNNNNNIYYNTTQTFPGFSIINLLNTSSNINKEKIKSGKIISMLLNKKIKKKKNNLSHSKERSSVSPNIKHSFFPSNKKGFTLNNTQKGKNKTKQKMNKPSLVLKK